MCMVMTGGAEMMPNKRGEKPKTNMICQCLPPALENEPGPRY